MSSGGTNTSTSSSAPPPEFLNAYSNVVNAAGQVASTPQQTYSGQTVADLSPDQLAAMGQVENAQGIAAPYINAAAQHLDAATTPLWGGVEHFSPSAIQQYQNPYTDSVVRATQADFNNQNDISNQRVIGNAVSQGAWGGDRSAVAQAINEGQNTRTQAPVLASLRNTGYQQAQQEFNQQQSAHLGANQANAWLNSQAAAGYGNLGQEALGTTLTGANALQSVGNVQQQQAQAGLNVPYQQYLAQLAYPFQTTGWLANISEGLGGASGGTSSTTSPAASVGSQIGGGLLAGAGILGGTGAFGKEGWLSNAFSGAGAGAAVPRVGPNVGDAVVFPSGMPGTPGSGLPSIYARGGGIPARADGGVLPSLAASQDYGSMSSPVPGVVGMDLGSAPASHGPMNILKNYGQTSTTTGGGDGGAGIFGDILAIASLAIPGAGEIIGPTLLALNVANQISHRAYGGGITSFPGHRARSPGTGRGIIANDDMPYVPHRAAGGAGIVPSVSVDSSMHGGIGVPRLSFAAPDSSSPSGLMAYLDQENAGRSYQHANVPVLNFGNLTNPGGTSVTWPWVPPGQPVPGSASLPVAASAAPIAVANVVPANAGLSGEGFGGAQARGGLVRARAEGGDLPPDTADGTQPEEDLGPTPGPNAVSHPEVYGLNPGGGPSVPGGGIASAPAVSGIMHAVQRAAVPVPLMVAAAAAVHQNESGGRMVPGILGDNGMSGGPMQVQRAALEEVNRATGSHVTFDQMVRYPEIGKQVGDAFLGMLMARYPGHPEYAIGAYNAGAGAMDRAIERGLGVAGLPAATQGYVARAVRAMQSMMQPPQAIARGGIVRRVDGGDVRDDTPTAPVRWLRQLLGYDSAPQAGPSSSSVGQPASETSQTDDTGYSGPMPTKSRPTDDTGYSGPMPTKSPAASSAGQSPNGMGFPQESGPYGLEPLLSSVPPGGYPSQSTNQPAPSGNGITSAGAQPAPSGSGIPSAGAQPAPSGSGIPSAGAQPPATGSGIVSPPPPPAPSGGGPAPHEAAPTSQPGATDKQSGDDDGKISVWRTLMNVGLGIMSGTSPQAGVNIGAGALKGLTLTDKEQQTLDQTMLRKSSVALNAEYRNGLLADRDEQRAIQKQRLNQNQPLVDARGKLIEAKTDALENGPQSKFTYQPATWTDPDDPSKTISGFMKLDPTGQNPPERIRTDTDPNKSGARGANTSALPDDTRIMLAERVVAGDNAALAGLGAGTVGSRNRLEVHNEVAKILKSKGLKGADLVAKTVELMGEKAGARTAGTRESLVGMAVNEAQFFMPLALRASDAAPRTRYPLINSFIQAYDKGTGDENIVRLAVATMSLTNAYARAVTPTGQPTEGSQTRARELLDRAWSQGQYAAAVDQLSKEMQAAKASPIAQQQEQKARVSGRAAPPQATGQPGSQPSQSAQQPARVIQNGWEYELGPDGQYKAVGRVP